MNSRQPNFNVRSTLSAMHRLPTNRYASQGSTGFGIRRAVGLKSGREIIMEDIFRTLDITNKTNTKSELIKSQITSIFNLIHNHKTLGKTLTQTSSEVNLVLQQLKENLRGNPKINYVLTKINDYIQEKGLNTKRFNTILMNDSLPSPPMYNPSLNNSRPILTPEIVADQIDLIPNIDDITNETAFIEEAGPKFREVYRVSNNQIIRDGIALWRSRKLSPPVTSQSGYGKKRSTSVKKRSKTSTKKKTTTKKRSTKKKCVKK